MKHIPFTLVLFLFAGLLQSACAPKLEVGEKIEPSRLEAIEGTDLNRVILTERAVERLGIETVSARGNEVPYAAIIYDTQGRTWVYSNPEPLTFVRVPIEIDSIEGNTAILSQALDKDLIVVTVGVSELYGTETGVSK